MPSRAVTVGRRRHGLYRGLWCGKVTTVLARGESVAKRNITRPPGSVIRDFHVIRFVQDVRFRSPGVLQRRYIMLQCTFFAFLLKRVISCPEYRGNRNFF